MPTTIHDTLKQNCENVISFLQTEFSGLQIGRAQAGLVENIQVDTYGTNTPLKGVASISIPDPKTIVIQPWDKGNMGAVEKAIRVSDIGLNPINDGALIRIIMPELTGERREHLVKLAHALLEKAKISIRQHRQDAHQQLKQMEKDKEISEDYSRRKNKQVQDTVDEYNKKIDELAKKKEDDIKTV